MIARVDYVDEKEDLALYPMPGGSIESEDLAGNQTVALNFGIAVKSQDQQKANAILWEINAELTRFDLNLPSQNQSYEFLGLSVINTPSLNELDEQGYYIYQLEITARLEIERN
ncbi:minor capsid protein [Streptococcus suis]